jgi:hypothetical protein
VVRAGDVLCLTASQRLQLETRAEPVREAVSRFQAAAAIRDGVRQRTVQLELGALIKAFGYD